MRLKEILEEKHWTGARLVKEVNAINDGITINRGLVSDLVNGSDREPRYRTMIKIAKVLNVSCDYLFEITDEPEYDMSIKSATFVTGITAQAIRSFNAFRELFPEESDEFCIVISFLMENCLESLLRSIIRTEYQKRRKDDDFDGISPADIRRELVDTLESSPEEFGKKYLSQITENHDDYSVNFGITGSLVDFFTVRYAGLMQSATYTLNDKDNEVFLSDVKGSEVADMYLMKIIRTLSSSSVGFVDWLHHVKGRSDHA